MSDDYYVYVLFRPWNGEPFYVGKGRLNRFGWHKKACSAKRTDRTGRIIRKSADLGLEIPAVKIREGLSEDAAHETEIALIAILGRTPNGVLSNLTDGGEGVSGRVYSETTREKMRAAMMGNKGRKGRPHPPEVIERLTQIQNNRSPETIEKMRASHLGKRFSDEHKAKLRAAKLGKKQSPDHVEKRAAANRGLKRSAEARANLSAGQIGNRNSVGRSLSVDARARISAAVSARWADPNGRLNLELSMRKPQQTSRPQKTGQPADDQR